VRLVIRPLSKRSARSEVAVDSNPDGLMSRRFTIRSVTVLLPVIGAAHAFASVAIAQAKDTIDVRNPIATYNAGAIHARLGHADSAFVWLNRSVALGFSDTAQFRKDSDLDSIRGDARYAKLIFAATHSPEPCADDADRRRFDFWIGEWTVTTKGGTPVGTSSVQRVSGGCALLENWADRRTGTGKSLNAYNPVTKQWQQFWVGQGGAVTEYRESEWIGPSLSYRAVYPPANGKPGTIIRLTFTPIDANTVRQFSDISNDGGKTWVVGYDFYYHRVRGE
jgi:hypothetical protein